MKEVIISEDGTQADVIVPDQQLSLAIGKEGQNARLAARLTGVRIDIRGETQHLEGPEVDYEEGEWVKNADTGANEWHAADGTIITQEQWDEQAAQAAVAEAAPEAPAAAETQEAGGGDA